jgi:hypothetical protein
VFAERIDSLRQAHPEEIATVFRHYPVTEQHPHAHQAALAAECAREQGRFEAYRGLLFREQSRIGRTSWSDFARQAAVPDTERFGRCMSDRRYARRIAADLKAGRRLGVPVTPTILVNQWKIVGVPDGQKLATLVEDALREARSAAQGGATTQCCLPAMAGPQLAGRTSAPEMLVLRSGLPYLYTPSLIPIQCPRWFAFRNFNLRYQETRACPRLRFPPGGGPSRIWCYQSM